jgi:ribosomal protein S6E (S10)
MPFKFEIAQGKKVCHYEADSESIIGKKLGENVDGGDIGSQFKGYEFQITGASDKSGFPALAERDYIGVRRVLLKKGKGMRTKYRGLRLKKSIHGNMIDENIVQINLKVTKAGEKSIAAILGKEEKPAGAKAEIEQAPQTA